MRYINLHLHYITLHYIHARRYFLIQFYLLTDYPRNEDCMGSDSEERKEQRYDDKQSQWTQVLL